jgi:hypothetical protein
MEEGVKIRYTQKQIDKYQRQKYIGELEKVSKNLFRMFRNKEMKADTFVKKFRELKEKLSVATKAPLDMGYYRELEAYIDRLFGQIVFSEDFDDKILDDIREAEMSNLNRLQKMKNSTSYKKAKHRINNEDWG